jgi:hypothetical protein
MPDDNVARQRLSRIQALWIELQHSKDPQQRRQLEEQLRREVAAYKQATGHDFDPSPA